MNINDVLSPISHLEKDFMHVCGLINLFNIINTRTYN